jgi:competence protein ComEC
MDAKDHRSFFAANPLVPAGALFLLGVALGPLCAGRGAIIIAALLAAWFLWILAEWRRRGVLAQAALAAALLCAGASLWALHQTRIEAYHVARFLPTNGEVPASLRATIIAAPDAGEPHTNRRFVVQTRQLCTNRGWINASGTVMVQAPPGDAVLPGAQVELVGWLSRPPQALNPGAIDLRRQLAADRIFAQMRVSHASGLTITDAAAARPAVLPRFRNFLRAKLLSHVVQEDVPAAYALTALLLGYRDQAIADVSQAFADAGVAHLLAISGSHIVFFTGLVWALLRFVPLRPRLRELLIAAILALYILATPLGPPILRAAVGLGMYVAARLAGRPRQYLNMLAGAAIIVVLLRPTDLLDAGFQLSFVTTAGLILFSRRVHGAIFGPWLATQTLVAELARTRLARWRLVFARFLAGALTANLIGATTALPLVAFHFGQVNLWAVPAGLAALPIVSLGMIAAALQLLLELVHLGAVIAPLSALVGRAMIWLVGLLAQIPGSALAMRSPPLWLVALAYGLVVMWALRRSLRVPRAAIINASVAIFLVTAAWYAATMPRGRAELTVLNVGAGSCILLRTPDGHHWAINAGAGQGASLTSQALLPALRRHGVRHLDGGILTALDMPRSGQLAELLETCRPAQMWVGDFAWRSTNETRSRWQLTRATKAGIVAVGTLHAGDVVPLSDAGTCAVEILWPPPATALKYTDLIALLHVGKRRVLLMDPAAAPALAQLPAVSADAVIFTGPQAGAADEAVRRLVGAVPTVWSGRGMWAPRAAHAEWNAADGAVRLAIENDELQIGRACP